MKDFRKNKTKTTFRFEWVKDQFDKIRRVISSEKISDKELVDILKHKFDSRRLVKGRIYNNVTKEENEMTQEDFINKMLREDVIMSGYGVLFRQQEGTLNMGALALNYLLDTRKKYKKMMFEHQPGTDEYSYYNLLQLTYKVIANSYYGVLGLRSSTFYNPYVQNSITATGQDIITTSIVSLENFMANNVKFNTIDDALTFIKNISEEEYSNNILDWCRPKTVDVVYEYLVDHLKKPKDSRVLKHTLDSLDQETLNRVYYKNQLFEVLNQRKILNIFNDMAGLEYGEEPSEELKPHLDKAKDLIMDFVYYDYPIEDRWVRINKDERESVILIDTDSNFINLDDCVKYMENNFDVDHSVKKNKISSTMLFIDLTTEVLKRTFWTMTTNLGLTDEYKPVIKMKSEFIYSRMLLTNNKKNYAGIIEATEGSMHNPILDMKGLAIKKSNVPKRIRKLFAAILEDDILKSETVSIKGVMDKFDNIRNSIKESMRKGETIYSLPKSCDILENYKDPYTQMPARGTIAWNALEPDDMIVLPDKINMVKLKTNHKDHPLLKELEKTHPGKYDIIMETIFETNLAEDDRSPMPKHGFTVVAVPKGVERVPDYLIPLIDIDSMADTNVKSGLIMLESLGIKLYDDSTKKQTYPTNIIEL